MAQLSTLGCLTFMKKPLVITLLVVLAILVASVIAFYYSRHSSLSGMWAGTHQITSSTDGPGSFNSKECRTFCRIKVSNRQVTGAITMFGLDAHAFDYTEELHGTIQNHVIEWKSDRSLETAKPPRQYETVFRGVRDGDTITGSFEQTWKHIDGKTVTYGGTVELKKQPNKSPEPTPVTFSVPHSRLTVSAAWLSFLR